jgi:large conductance mechanosensitive channel
MLKEFKEFALRGNVIDMAVGIIIGGAFGKIVTSLVNDLIMPIFGHLLAGMDFTDLKIVLSEAQMSAAGEVIKPEAAIMYGNFIQVTIDFILIALSIFLVIRIMNKMRRQKETVEEAVAETPVTPTETELLTEIRDLLKNK